MPVTSTNASRDDLVARRAELLEQIGSSLDELTERRTAGLLTAEEWEAWEEIDGIGYLLDDA